MAGLVACGNPAASCSPEGTLVGSWHYDGDRDAPAPALLDGTLEITSESCDGFQGRLDVLQSDAAGMTRRLAGPVAGRLTTDASLRFDAWLSGVTRQHVASLGVTGAEGSWVVAGGPEGSEAGNFRIVRSP